MILLLFQKHSINQTTAAVKLHGKNKFVKSKRKCEVEKKLNLLLKSQLYWTSTNFQPERFVISASTTSDWHMSRHHHRILYD